MIVRSEIPEDRGCMRWGRGGCVGLSRRHGREGRRRPFFFLGRLVGWFGWFGGRLNQTQMVPYGQQRLLPTPYPPSFRSFIFSFLLQQKTPVILVCNKFAIGPGLSPSKGTQNRLNAPARNLGSVGRVLIANKNSSWNEGGGKKGERDRKIAIANDIRI